MLAAPRDVGRGGRPGNGLRRWLLPSPVSARPRIERILRAAEYLGACVIQAPGAWTRIGGTWVDAAGRWWCAGPGVDLWGTTGGLAELASATTATPTWHAAGIACAPAPHIVFAVAPEVLAHHGGVLAAWAAEADVLVAEWGADHA